MAARSIKRLIAKELKRGFYMFRKIVSVALFVSFIAMSTSGLMMFFIERPSFTIQMHPVHKLFGLIMILAVIGHLFSNLKSIVNYLKNRNIAIFGASMVCMLVLLYGVALNNEVPSEIAIPMDKLAAEVEAQSVDNK
ncbi:MAG: putative membrane protein [Psychromonas sp.]